MPAAFDPSSSSDPAWDAARLNAPHAVADKAARVEEMFTAIAPSYDLNNRVHSFGRDQAWRRATVKLADLKAGDCVLDVACGTGDLTLAFAQAQKKLESNPPSVTGVDFTYAMLPLAKQKSTGKQTRYVHGDAMALPLPDASVDVVSIAFGIRNVIDPAAALAEFARVLRPGGRLMVLEFTVPRNPVMRLGYNFYCGWLMPRTATLISGDRSGAYRYLPRSVSTFASAEQLRKMMALAGLVGVETTSLTLGIAACHRGVKPR
ncbi:MAG: bifunctional demethylmenaquinone methyltransferase/2-methoxy-6-polyprenyl-1,4-benzoquinol methylase UbiE [Algisphaera sp.]